MASELIKKLLEAGVHFGHQSRRWNPKMKRFIFGERGGIYIIDLEKSVEKLTTACEFIRDVASKGGKILFVGTKKQAQQVIEEEALRAEGFYVKSRWMGGLLTNLETVKKSVKKLIDIERMETNGTMTRFTKKEASLLMKEKDRLVRDLGGIREMHVPPAVIFIVDTKKEEIAVAEANRLGIPVIGLIDTNSDPDLIQYPIPGNDDAVKSIKFITSMIVDNVLEGRKEFLAGKKVQQEAQAQVVAAA